MIAEAGKALGLAGFDIHTWFCLFGPARLPAEPMPSTPARFGEFVKSELAKYEAVVKASGARVE